MKEYDFSDVETAIEHASLTSTLVWQKAHALQHEALLAHGWKPVPQKRRKKKSRGTTWDIWYRFPGEGTLPIGWAYSLMRQAVRASK